MEKGLSLTLQGYFSTDISASVRVQSRVPCFEEKSLVVISFENNNLNVFKVHVVVEMGTIISYFQKPTKASCKHELYGHMRKLCVTLL